MSRLAPSPSYPLRLCWALKANAAAATPELVIGSWTLQCSVVSAPFQSSKVSTVRACVYACWSYPTVVLTSIGPSFLHRTTVNHFAIIGPDLAKLTYNHCACLGGRCTVDARRGIVLTPSPADTSRTCSIDKLAK